MTKLGDKPSDDVVNSEYDGLRARFFPTLKMWANVSYSVFLTTGNKMAKEDAAAFNELLNRLRGQ